MRRHARSEKRRKVLRRIREGERGEGAEEEEEVAGAAEIGSRVFPFRTPPPPAAPMPTVGTRRSTRVFVPKQQQRPPSGDGDSARVLRSGKQFALSMAREDDGSDWLKILGGGGGGGGSDLNSWWNDEGKRDWKEEVVEIDKGIEEKKIFGVVYSRKRRRSTTTADGNGNDRRFGIVFERKHRKKEPKAQTLVGGVTRGVHGASKRTTGLRVKELCFIECLKSFVEKLGILDSDIWSGLDCGPLVLAVLVDSSVSYSSDRFARLLVSVMNWTRRARAELLEFVAVIFTRSILSFFSLIGIHFVPLRHQKNRILDSDSISGCGFCKIYGVRDFVPLLTVGYAALPSYFKFLHAILNLGSQYLPSILGSEHLVPMAENSLMVLPCKTHIYGDHPLEMGFPRTECTVSESPAVNEMLTIEDSSVPGSPNSVFINGSRLRKHKRKRSLLKNSRAHNLSSINSRFGSFRSGQNGSSVSMTAKHDFVVTPVSVKPPDTCLSDLFVGRDESDTPSSPGSCSKLRKSAGTKSPMDKIKEMRLALTEVRQNVDSTCSNVNILVSDAEKCWREDGARVVLEMSGSQEWFLAVKRGDTTMFLHKPHDLKSFATNRFTHAYIWTGDDGWRLEFCDKWDWHVFKELHAECRYRNTEEVSVKVKVKAIPVPGVREVSGYEDDVLPSFTHPDIYIHMVDDEVGRALASGISYYDMDLADEDWLRHLNSSLSDAQDGGSNYVSEENFERIIFTLEKDAYSCPDDASDKDRALDLCKDLGSRDMMSAIYDYWLKKRKQKHKPLTRVFQFHPPLRRTQLIQKPFLRKKRSFKRQRSQPERNQAEWNQAGQGKHDLFLQAHQEAVRRVQEAEAAASRAAETATQLRTRAQLLMSNADLAAYKAAMALRIAEAIWVSSSSSLTEPPDLDSSILFD